MPVTEPATGCDRIRDRLRAVLLAVAMLWTSAAFAQPVSHPELADPLPGAENRIYADLVRLVAPGVGGGNAGASGSGVIDIRHIDGADMTGFEPVSVASPRIAAIPVRSGGLDRLALLLDLGESRHDVSDFVVLALFEVADQPRLLDAATVAFDRYTFFPEPARLPIGTGDDLLVTRSTHFNSSQGYATTALILLREDRLELVDAISTFDDRACAFERTQRLEILQGAGAPFADIEATVIELTAGSGERCGDAAAPEPGTRSIAVTYRWDAAEERYIADSDAFGVLARENEERF